MARRTRGTFSNQGGGISLWGVDELISKLESLGGNVGDAAEEALKRSAEIVEADMRNFMKEHTKPTPGPHTIDTLDTEIKRSGTSISGVTGFKMRNVPGAGDIPVGLPALFLDIGTQGGPHIKPTYFVYYAYKNNADKITHAQREVFRRYISDIMEKGG